MSCPQYRTSKEYQNLLNLTNGNISLSDQIGELSDGNIPMFETKAEVFKYLESKLIEKAKSKEKLIGSEKSMVNLNPTFVFNYRERQEILNSLMHIVTMGNGIAGIKSVQETKDSLKLENLKKEIELLSKAFPAYKDNYDKLLKEDVLEEFIVMLNQELVTMDPEYAENEEADEYSKNSSANYRDSNLEDQTKKASAAAKLMIRFLPSGKKGTALGLPTYSNAKKNEKLIMEALASNPYRDGARITNMFDRLDKLAMRNPQFTSLVAELRALRDTKSEFFNPALVQFVRAFDKNFENYTSTFIEEFEDGTYISKIGSSDTNSPEKVLAKLWEDNFNEIYYREGDNGVILFNREKAEATIKRVENIQVLGVKNKIVTPEMIQELSSTFQDFGIEFDEQFFNDTVLNTDNPIKEFNKLVDKLFLLTSSTAASRHSLSELLKVKDFGNAASNNKLNNPIEDNSNALAPLAKIQTFFMEDIANSTVYAGGKMYQQYVLYNYLSLVENDLNLGADSQHLALLDSDIYTANSRWKQALKDGSKIKFGLFNSAKLETSESKDASEISESDEFLDRIERTLRGRFIFMTLADKGRVYDISGMPSLNASTRELSNDIVDTFTGYFFDELVTMQKAWEELYGDNPIEDKDKIEYYHTRGNVFTSTIFPSLSPGGELANRLEEEGISLYQKHDKPGKPFSIDSTVLGFTEEGKLEMTEGIRDKLRPHIKTLLQNKIDENTARIEEKGLLNLLDKTVVSRYKGASDLDTMSKISAAYTIDALAANIEQAKLFTGDPRMYKTIEDFLKRTPAVAATGDRLLVGKNVRSHFNVSIIKGFIKPSEIYSNEGYIQKLMEFAQDSTSIAKALNLEAYDSAKHASKTPFKAFDDTQWVSGDNPYDKINTTDAQAWISMDRFKEIISGLQGWTNELETAFQNIKNKKGTPEDYKLFIKKNLSMQPKKGMHYELISKGGKLVPVYLKYSQAVLFPELVTGNSELERMVELMGNTVDEVIVTDGIKVGAHGVVDITNPDAKLNKIRLSNQYWKLQQDLPKEGLGNKLVLSQPKKNIIADIDLDVEYLPGLTGRQLVEALHDVDVELSNIGLAKLRNKIYTDGKIDLNKVRQKLLEDFKEEGESQDLIKALQDGIALDALPNYRRNIMSKIANWYTKASVKLKQNGGSAIQLSDLGFMSRPKTTRIDQLSKEDTQGIVWLYDGIESLLPPRADSNAEGVEFKPGQVLLNYSYAKLIPNFKSIKNDPEKLRAAINPELLRIIASRVPNQKLSFNTSIEVVGFLPEHVGDTIVAYKEITATTGSDFDIDKLYFMIPNYFPNKKTGRLDYIKFSADLSEEATKERYTSYLDALKFRDEVKAVLMDTGLTTQEIKDLSFSMSQKEFEERFPNLETIGITLESTIEALEMDEVAMSFKEFSSQSIYKQNSKKANENRRIELYRMVLENPKNMSRLISAVDSSWLKDFIDTIIPTKSISDLDLYDGYFQMMKRREFLSSKGSVGQIANHVGDHALSQEAMIYMLEKLGVGNTTEDGFLDLSNSYTPNFEVFDPKTSTIEPGEQYLITEILSVFMNAFVDAAKDNYIGRANFNATTNNVAFMLMRGGVSPHYVVALLAQPIIVEYVNRTSSNRGLRGDKLTKKDIQKKLLKDFGSSEELGTNYKLSDFSTQDLINSITTKERGARFNEQQAALLSIFINTLEPLAQDLRSSVAASTADREGTGANISDAYIRLNSIENVAGTSVKGFENKFKRPDGRNTMLGAAVDNSLVAFTTDMKGQFMENTPGFQTIVNAIYDRLYGKMPDDIEKVNKISKLVYGTMMHQFSKFKLENNELKDLIVGENTLAHRLKDLKHRGYGEINEFIDYLSSSINYSSKSPSFVAVNNTKIITPKVSEMLSYSWLELYWSKNPELRQFAKDLAHYSFYSSLFADNLTSFYRLLPYPISRDLGISNQLTAEIRSALSTYDVSKYEPIIDNVLRNLLADQSFTSKVPKKSLVTNVTLKSGDKVEGKSFLRIINPKEATTVISSTDALTGDLMYKPYIRMSDSVTTGTGIRYQVENYYKHQGTVTTDDGITYPVYIRTNKLGYKRSRYQIYEVNVTDMNPKSIIEKNNVQIEEKTRETLANFVKDNVTKSTTNLRVEGADINEIVNDMSTQSTNLLTESIAAENVKEGVSELFEQNPELANEVYSKILTNSGLSAENLLSLLLKDNLIEKQCS